MLDEQSYALAIYCYTGAAGIMLLYLAWWLSRHWRWPWVAATVLVAAAVLLVPAYPQPDAATMAPAAIVAGFQFMLDGPEVAMHTLKPIGLLSIAAVALVLLLRLLVFRPRTRAGEAPPVTVAAEGGER